MLVYDTVISKSFIFVVWWSPTLSCTLLLCTLYKKRTWIPVHHFHMWFFLRLLPGWTWKHTSVPLELTCLFQLFQHNDANMHKLSSMKTWLGLKGWSGGTRVSCTDPWAQPHWTPLEWPGTRTTPQTFLPDSAASCGWTAKIPHPCF